MATDRPKAKKYLVVLTLVTLFLLLAELGANYLADPLFFFGGSKVSDKGYYMNERIFVIARNRNQWRKFDCVLLGSSRFVFLDVSKISNRSCANISVSGGLVDEFVEYGNYLKAKGVRPKLVIIGVDKFDAPLTLKEVPEFVRNKKDIPSWISYYASIDTLWFSIQVLTGFTRSPNYYDKNYRKHIGHPPRRVGEVHPEDEFHVMADGPGHVTARIPYYEKLCRIFPEARCVGIVPPTSTWALEKALNQGIDPYLRSMERLSRIFDTFYDFSILEKPEWDFSETSDGVHFSANAYDNIAAKIENPAHEAWGFDVKALPFALYKKRYIEDAQKAVEKRKQFVARNMGIADNSKGH